MQLIFLFVCEVLRILLNIIKYYFPIARKHIFCFNQNFMVILYILNWNILGNILFVYKLNNVFKFIGYNTKFNACNSKVLRMFKFKYIFLTSKNFFISNIQEIKFPRSKYFKKICFISLICSICFHRKIYYPRNVLTLFYIVYPISPLIFWGNETNNLMKQ